MGLPNSENSHAIRPFTHRLPLGLRQAVTYTKPMSWSCFGLNCPSDAPLSSAPPLASVFPAGGCPGWIPPSAAKGSVIATFPVATVSYPYKIACLKLARNANPSPLRYASESLGWPTGTLQPLMFSKRCPACSLKMHVPTRTRLALNVAHHTAVNLLKIWRFS